MTPLKIKPAPIFAPIDPKVALPSNAVPPKPAPNPPVATTKATPVTIFIAFLLPEITGVITKSCFPSGKNKSDKSKS